MDLEEWEYLTNDFDDFYDRNEKKIHVGSKNHNPRSLLNMDYFSPDPPRIIKELAPIKIQPPPPPPPPHEEKSKANTFPSTPADPEGYSDTVSETETDQVSGQFVDMKEVESSKGCGFMFDDHEKDEDEMMISPRKKKDGGKMSMVESGEDEMMMKKKEEDVNGGIGVWKWSLSGIRAICSFGVAAATVCIIVLGSNQKNKHHNQNIRFQIYADDKRIEQVVQQATKMNEAISAARGAQIASAHISFGGYYNGV